MVKKPHPAKSPARSNRSSHGGNEMAEALRIKRVTMVTARVCAVTWDDGLEIDDVQADLTTFPRADGGTDEQGKTVNHQGSGD